MSATIETDAVTLQDYLRVVRRRKWVVVQAALLGVLAAVAFSLHQPKSYEASADVLLNSQNPAATLPGAPLMGLSEDPERITQTQARVARLPAIVRRVLAQVRGTGLTVTDFLADSSVSSSPGSDILTFAVTSPDPALTERLVNAYAYAYSGYRQQLDTSSIQRALEDVERRLQELERAGASLERRGASFGALTRYGALYTSLLDRQQTLESMQTLQTPAASVVRQADGTVLTQPKTLRNGAIGLVLGLVLGLGLAFLLEALETRARTAEEVSTRLGGLPLLGRLPEPPKRLRKADRLVMLEEPASARAEAFRMLRAKLDFVMLDRDARTIMVTSALQQEGKSTTVANLAVAFARAGKHVALVDLDLRRPILARFFDLKGPGVTNVALGHVPLDEALTEIVIADPPALRRASPPEGGSGNGNRIGELSGLLEVLASGPIPPDPGEFVSSPALGKVLRGLRERADIVLVDAPHALQVGDAIALSSRVDGIVVVARSKALRRQTLAELNRQLATMGAPALGLVATGEREGDGYAVGFDSDGYRSGVAGAVRTSSGTEPARTVLGPPPRTRDR